MVGETAAFEYLRSVEESVAHVEAQIELKGAWKFRGKSGLHKRGEESAEYPHGPYVVVAPAQMQPGA